MPHRVEVSPSAARDLKRLPLQVCQRLETAILALADEPYPRGVRKIQGTQKGLSYQDGELPRCLRGLQGTPTGSDPAGGPTQQRRLQRTLAGDGPRNACDYVIAGHPLSSRHCETHTLFWSLRGSMPKQSPLPTLDSRLSTLDSRLVSHHALPITYSEATTPPSAAIAMRRFTARLR